MLFVVCDLLLDVSGLLFAVARCVFALFVACCLLLDVRCLLFVDCCSLDGARRWLFVDCWLLFVDCCLLIAELRRVSLAVRGLLFVVV